MPPLGVVHAYTSYDDGYIRYMLSVCYLMAYKGGQVQPRDTCGAVNFDRGAGELADERVVLLVQASPKMADAARH